MLKFLLLQSPKKKNKDKVKEWKKVDKERAVEDNGKGKEKQDVGPPKGKEKTGKFAGCFLCNGSHMARDCLKSAKLVNALLAKNKEEAQSNEQLMSFLSPLCVLNKKQGQKSICNKTRRQQSAIKAKVYVMAPRHGTVVESKCQGLECGKVA
ncbi:hypothetical protein HAX54_026659 [Datura stramonium]|uniref:Uncharacterized protein n=1 Tax=Datura stramonium TaxID=4076 RepID=A0ABS8V1K1_DATST|nr:hypothetical protein [Datura stramonium]